MPPSETVLWLNPRRGLYLPFQSCLRVIYSCPYQCLGCFWFSGLSVGLWNWCCGWQAYFEHVRYGADHRIFQSLLRRLNFVAVTLPSAVMTLLIGSSQAAEQIQWSPFFTRSRCWEPSRPLCFEVPIKNIQFPHSLSVALFLLCCCCYWQHCCRLESSRLSTTANLGNRFP